MAMSDVVISGRQLKPGFSRQHAVAGINIDINDASIVGIIGPDVEFKSGWLRVLSGVENSLEGDLHIFGQDASTMSKPEWQSMRVNLAYLNKDTALLSVLGTLENILLPSLYHKLGQRDKLIQKANELLQEIEFEDMASLNKLPAYLNDYEYCQAIIVRALLLKPRVLVLDNVFKKLDAESADKLMTFVVQYVKSHGMALLFHASKLDFVLEFANRILFVTQRFMLQFNDKNDIRISDNENVIKYLQDNYVN